ncbi:hypothetical protein SAMN05216232_0396 [Virgibacillus subterraneus]|uniref:DUF4871 domain-containing protein n=1 Tax=Virgibacillus subterraneus TaxID=621109 RepID=A0A1H8ZDU9_9BACI|nr:hypothetical protein [Virgibacillus subterraneus]SEP62551.1 hypothetical protein SAMN05216232_0396 [Virgibacillus subterraneus]
MGCTKEETTNEDEKSWEESPTLVREVVVTDDGKKGNFVFRIGNNGKFGFSEYGPFIEGVKQKYMWFFWGNEDTFTQPFKVVGISKKTNERITVFEGGNEILSPHLGADQHIPSSMILPSSGKWRLEVYFDEELFGHVIVNVEGK